MADSPYTRRAPRSPNLTVVLTLEKIEESIRRDSKHCWIAEAIKEQFPFLTNVLVDTATIRASHPDKGLRYIYLTPQIARNGIYRYDHGEPVEPFSFQLRAAHVRGIRSKDGAKKRMSFDTWQKMKKQIQKISSEEGLKMTTIAKEMKIPYGTLQARIHDDQIPTATNANKIEKWVLARTGEKPAPRVTSLADKASGRARIRAWNPKMREQPEIIGGGEPVKAMHLSTRQFGLRQLNWKIPGTETTLRPPPLHPSQNDY